MPAFRGDWAPADSWASWVRRGGRQGQCPQLCGAQSLPCQGKHPKCGFREERKVGGFGIEKPHGSCQAVGWWGEDVSFALSPLPNLVSAENMKSHPLAAGP